ncbi:insulin-like [Episyrphus balteatus]|uniref:insulin-like n=1 Tax=Episyrphus balteatus TaxID=286459 RepID=UPI002485DB9D|nr:insulin-like [Episyrphus balteatus]
MLMYYSLATLNIFLVFATIVSTFSGFPMYSCNDHHKNIEFKIYCSSSLSDALQLICGGKFYSFSKKFPEAIGGPLSTRMYRESAFLRKLIPEDFFQPLNGNGSIHECCRRPCGYSELKMYCAND